MNDVERSDERDQQHAVYGTEHQRVVCPKGRGVKPDYLAPYSSVCKFLLTLVQ
jgi:hypothetical protein